MSNASAALEPYGELLSRPLTEVAADLESFAALLLKWNRAQNLVSRETVDQLWPRHIADSLQLLPLIHETDKAVLDIGSGGGFPAIPLAIALRDSRDFILVEPIGKKSSFLKHVSRELGLGLRVETARIEALTDVPNVQLITSRALAALPTLLNLAVPHFGASTRALFHKGRDHGEELAESRLVYYFDVIVHPSTVDASGVVLEISNLRRRDK